MRGGRTAMTEVSVDAAPADAGQQLASILEETAPAEEESDATEADATSEDASVGRALVLAEVVERARERRLSQHGADDEKIALGMEVLLRLHVRGTRELVSRRGAEALAATVSTCAPRSAPAITPTAASAAAAAGGGGASSSTMCTLAPPIPKEETPARRGTPPAGAAHGAAPPSWTKKGVPSNTTFELSSL